MIKSRIAAAAALLAVAGAAQAEVSVDAAWVSEYDWRGVQQTDGHDAFQLSGTYTHESGFYAGAWGSTLIEDAEIDVFAGYAADIGDSGLGYDVGLNYYTFTNNGGTDANFLEAYAGLNYGVFSGKLWYSPKFGGDGGDPAFYLEGNAAIPLGSNGFNLLAHVGYSKGDGIELYYGDDSYVDWSVGLGYDVGNFSTFVKWVDGSDVAGGNFDSQARVVFGISTTLPWGN